MTRGSGGSLALSGQRTFTSNHSPACPGALGVYLVFTSLIVPALAAAGRVQWRALGLAWLIGAVGYALGLLASALADLPSGPAIVWSIAVSALLIGYLLRSKPLDRTDAVDPARVRPETGN